MVLRTGVFILAALNQLTASQLKACIPVIADGVDIEPEKLIGTWHEYQATDGADEANIAPIAYNVIAEVSIIPSRYQSPDTVVTKGILTSWMPGDKPSDPKKCLGIFGQLNYHSNGKRSGLVFFGDPQSEDVTYTTLFTDYDLMEINYRCRFKITNQSKTDTEKYCQDPLFWVETRIPGYQMIREQKAYIHGVVNNVLFDYCVSNKDFGFTGSSAQLQPCSPEAPPGSTALLNNA